MTPPYFDEHRITPIQPHPHDASEKCPGGCDDILIVEKNICDTKKHVEVLESRLKDSHDRATRIETRLDESYLRMGRVEALLGSNIAKIDKNSLETSEILEIMQDGKAFFRFASKAGEVLKWTLGIATAVAAFWLTVKGWAK